MRDIRRLMSEIAALNSRILEHVYRKAWDRELLSDLRSQVDRKQRELDELRTVYAGTRYPAPELTANEDARGIPLTVHDTRLIANALYTQRPLIYQSEEWLAFRRVCAALVRLFAFELQAGGEFDSVEFLKHCGLSMKDAEEISRRPGEFIRRSEELPDG